MMDGALIVHTGASRTFKTLRARFDTKDARRLLVWDPKGKWAELDRCTPVTTIPELVKLIRATGEGGARIALVTPKRELFGPWAEAAFYWGRWGAHGGIRTNIVAEEIANVTHPGKAPEGFHLLISQGLEFGITMHVLTQAPSESDKTSFRNRTVLRVGQCDRDKDAKYMADELRIDQVHVDALRDQDFLERTRAGQVVKYRASPGKIYPKWTQVPL